MQRQVREGHGRFGGSCKSHGGMGQLTVHLTQSRDMMGMIMGCALVVPGWYMSISWCRGAVDRAPDAMQGYVGDDHGLRFDDTRVVRVNLLVSWGS